MRILLGVLGYASLFWGLPWFTGLCIVLLALRYRAWEAILLGLFMDLMWLPSPYTLYTLPYFTLGSLVVVWGLEPLRRQFLR